MNNQQSNQLVVIFGLPGAGKTYVANILKNHFGFYFYDGDKNLSYDMKYAIKMKIPFTDLMRDSFFKRLNESVNRLINRYTKVVVAQTFIKEKYRTNFLHQFPNAQFILVTADDQIREERLMQRSSSPLDIEYSRLMIKNFDYPKLFHYEIVNSDEGQSKIIENLESLGLFSR